MRIRATELPNGPNVDNLVVTGGATPHAPRRRAPPRDHGDDGRRATRDGDGHGDRDRHADDGRRPLRGRARVPVVHGLRERRPGRLQQHAVPHDRADPGHARLPAQLAVRSVERQLVGERRRLLREGDRRVGNPQTSGRTGRESHILLVDDRPLVRLGLRSVVAADPMLVVCGETGTAAGAVEMSRTLRP